MAKKKKRKVEKKPSSGYKVELIGVILIAISIIGICQFGIVGNFLSGFASFLVGTAYNILLASLLVIGIYMIVKRQAPDFFTSKLVGLYIIVLSLLILFHANYIKHLGVEGFEVIKETINNLMGAINGVEKIQGGGIFGAILSVLFVKLFTVTGTRVVCVVLLICGVVMFTGMSIYDMITKSRNKVKEVIKKSHKDKEQVKIIEENYEKDNKVIISSMDDLLHTDEKIENKPVNTIEESIPDTSIYKYPPISLLKVPNNKKNNDYTKLIKEWELKLSEKEEYYYKKFSAMETALAKVNSTQSSLTGYFS